MPLSTLTDEQLNAIAERIAESLHADTNGTRPTWGRGLNVTVAILVISGMLVSAGVTLSKVGTVDEAVRENKQAVTDVTKELESVRTRQLASEGDQRVINEKLNTIISQIAELKGQVYAARPR